jgi:N-acetyl sugar amidotransferase
MNTSYIVCSRCVCDSRIPGIHFDEKGECNFCKINDALEKEFPLGKIGKENFQKLIAAIKKDGKGKEYDCVVGVSGGRDSTYTLYMAVKNGLRPLAVHFDNGWNSDVAVRNIKKSTKNLNVDLHTLVADWEEFKDLQKSFLKASTPDAEVPTDYAIISTLYKVANQFKVKYILSGHSFRTEGVSPLRWTYMDGRYIRAVHRRFGSLKIKSFPIMSVGELAYFSIFKRMHYVPFLSYLDYNHEEAESQLKEIGWQYYGGHHYECIYTKFFQSYLCPTKFNIDERMIEYSALIRSGQITRSEAFERLKKTYDFDKGLIEYLLSKMGMTKEEFQKILAEKPKSFLDYPSYYPLIRFCKIPIKIACKIKMLPSIFYQKYFE